MRDESRIDDILDRLKVLWKKYPDMRLGQLIGNAANFNNPAMYYIEDNQFMELLEKFYSINK